MRRNIIFALLVLIIASCAETRKTILPTTDVSRDVLLSEHNHYRQNPLQRDESLESFAQKHAEWMARNDSLEHSNLRISGWSRMGENIAWGQSDEFIVTRQWMNSSGHKANITNPRFTHVGFGFGFAKSSDERIYWCAVFGG